MAQFTYATLTTAILNFTETDTTVLSSTITDQLIGNAEERIFRDINIDANKFYFQATVNSGQGTYNAPSGCLIIRALKMTDTSNNMWYLQKVDQTMLDEYTQDETNNTGKPRYWANYDGGDGSSSGYYKIAPSPDAAYTIEVEYLKMPTGLSGANTTTYLSQRFGNGLLYACIVEAYGYLKGPMDMLTMYEQKYNNVVQKFAAEQIGRRRRDDYTDGTIRIPIESPNP